MDTTQSRTYNREPGTSLRLQPEWIVVKEYKDEAAGLCVQVQKLAGNRPLFSIDLGGLRDGEFSRHIKPRVSGEGKEAAVATFGMVAARLLDEAVLYVQEQVQQQRPRPAAGGFGQKAVGGGLSRFSDGSKTEREAAKRARHENNLAARRSEDQERTRRSKSR